jgi:hypothetical protein
MSDAICPPLSTHYAAEIERAMVSLLWHEPERCSQFFQQLDPALHLREPRSRIIAKAINLAFGELGTTDWATVIQVVRELGQYEECGGAEGLNEIYVAKAFRSSKEASDLLFAHYMEMLKTYAKARASKEDFPVARFVGGSGQLSPNKNKRYDSNPDFLGTIKITGHLYRAAAWLGTDGIRLKLLPP